MAVEKLMVVEGPMYGFDDNLGAIESASEWMRSNGINPAHVVIGGLAGAVLNSEKMVHSAVKWALLVGAGSYLLNRVS